MQTLYDYREQLRSQIECEIACHATSIVMAGNQTPGAAARWLRRAAIHRDNARHYLRRLRDQERMFAEAGQ